MREVLMRLGFVLVDFQAQFLDVKHDVCNVFANAWNRGKFVEHAVDSDCRDRRAFQTRKKHSAQAVADCDAVAATERFADKFAVMFVVVDFDEFNLRRFLTFVFVVVDVQEIRSFQKQCVMRIRNA